MVPYITHVTQLYQIPRYNSDEKKALEAEESRKQKAMLQQLALSTKRPPMPPREERDPKRANTAHEATSRNGDLIFLGDDKDRMPLPKITDPKERPCAAFYRQGHICKRGDRCKYSHVSIDKLSPATQKEWIAHVRSNDTISFNPKRVKSALASMNTDKKPAATTTEPEE